MGDRRTGDLQETVAGGGGLCKPCSLEAGEDFVEVDHVVGGSEDFQEGGTIHPGPGSSSPPPPPSTSAADPKKLPGPA